MSWDYRVVRKRISEAEWYAVHEVFTDDEGRIWGCTEDPIAPGGESREDLVRELAEHLMAAISDEETLDIDLIPQPGAINPTDVAVAELEAGTATTIPFSHWNIKGIDCGHCLHWRRRRCTIRPLGVRDREFGRASRYAATRRTDWCARFEEA